MARFNRYTLFLLFINVAAILGFSIYYIAIKNFEFLWYIGVMVFFLVLIGATLHRSKFNNTILSGLTLWGLLHLAGGGVKVGEGVLYTYKIIPLFAVGDNYILKFDQLVHFVGFGVATLLALYLLLPYLNEKTNWKVIYPLIIVTGMGIGAVNEIVEFIAVVTFPETGVGGYYNTMLDIIFNTFGAIVAVIYAHLAGWREKYRVR